MKNSLAIVSIFFLLSSPAVYGQDWQAVFTMDSRIGYTTNTYLNPFISDWDPSVNAAYGFVAPLAQISFGHNRFSSDATGSLFFEPVFDGRTPWKGGFGVLNSRYRLAEKLFAGVDAGGSYTTGLSGQTFFWVVPNLTYSPSLFTQFRLKAGSSFREFRSETEAPDGLYRFNSYAVEMETWPDFNWRLKGGIYGNLENPAENLSTVASVDYLVSSSLRFSLRSGLEQYQYQVITETGGGGGPPIGGPQPPGEEVSDEADRIFRTGISGTYQISRSFAVTLNADYLKYFSTAAEQTPANMHASAGFRFSFSTKRHREGSARAEWKQNGRQTVILHLKGGDEGKLYLLGDFNNWEHPGVPLSHQKGNRYAVQLSLKPGAHEYKVLLIKESGEEQWIELSEDTYTVSDGFGGENGLIFIE